MFVGTSVPFDRRMRNAQTLLTFLRENPLNRVSNEVRAGARFQTQLPSYPAIQIIIHAEANDTPGIGGWHRPHLTSTDR